MKAYKAAKTTKKATTKIKRSPSKKVSSKVNKKPKTVAAKPIRTAPKVQSKAKVKVAATTVKPKKKTKTYVAPRPKRNTVVTRVERVKVVKALKSSPKGGSSTAGKSSSSNKQIMEDSVDDTNNATKVVQIKVPKGVEMFEGLAAPQRGLVGGGNQVWIREVNPSWLIK
ncbi:hypothetical protein HRF87_17680 [Bacillus sp. CRN 9]|nr:hypothetical protein [Bacillus sp. CRN 9]